MELYQNVRDLTPLKSSIKKVIYNLVIDSDRLEFFLRSTFYEDNNGSIDVATNPRINPTSNHIGVKYHWFRQRVGKEFLIHKIESENHKAYFSPKFYKVVFFRIAKFLCGW